MAKAVKKEGEGEATTPSTRKTQVSTASAAARKKYEGKDPEEIRAMYGSWSAAMRAMCAEGFTFSEVASKLGKLYQHVRNVMLQPVPQGKPTASSSSKRTSKAGDDDKKAA